MVVMWQSHLCERQRRRDLRSKAAEIAVETSNLAVFFFIVCPGFAANLMARDRGYGTAMTLACLAVCER